jgi:glycosyltransferase involved in cell wall biosynthesis
MVTGAASGSSPNPGRRRLRVLFIASDLGPGGSERQALALSRRLPRDRFEPAFVLIGEPGIFGGVAEAEGIRVTALGLRSPREIGYLRFAARTVRAVGRYVAAARRGRFDIVDAWLYHGYWLAALARPLAGVPLLVAGRRSLSDFKDRWGWLASTIDGFASRQARVIVANSELVRADVIEREGIDPARIVVIRNGVELPAPTDAATRRAARTRWDIADDAFVVGCVSNLKPTKGIDHLLRAFARLERSEATRLVVIGEGPSRVPLTELARSLGVRDRVLLAGTEPDVQPLLAGFDVFVHPSDTEGLPNAVLEAAAAGLPIVATDVGGTSEIVIDGRTGVLVPAGDVPAIAAAIERLRDDAPARSRLGFAAREHARTTFGMERLVAETAELYERLAGGDGPPRDG